MIPDGTRYIRATVTKEALCDPISSTLAIFRIMRKNMRHVLIDSDVPLGQHAVHWLRFDAYQDLYEYMMLVAEAANVRITTDDKMHWRADSLAGYRYAVIRRGFLDA